MQKTEVGSIVRSLLIHHFDIQPETFSWEKKLEELQANFKILSQLVFLEQLIQKEFGKNIGILEEISTAFHTPEDLVEVIVKSL